MIKNLPDDGHVFYQRIEDSYFNEYNWKEYEYKGVESCVLSYNSKIDGQEKCPRGYWANELKYNKDDECKGCEYSNKYIHAY